MRDSEGEPLRIRDRAPSPYRRGLGRVAVALVLAPLGCASGSGGGPYEFALLGDNPYVDEDVPRFEALVEDVNARPDLEWVLHVGDISGREPCTDELYRRRFDLYQRFQPPFVYTPGDNDWFDCVRESQGGYDEYERLQRLREVFFPDPSRTSGGRAMPVRSQGLEADHPGFVENVLWVRGDAVFATVHLIRLTRPPTDPAAAEARLAAALDWIDTAFRVAREEGARGVFLAAQADPWVFSALPVLLEGACPACTGPAVGLEPLYPALVRHADAFDGEVVLAVGDTHIFRVDKPLYRDDGSPVENFTRVETFGSPQVHWVRVTVDPSDRQLFTFHQELVPGNRRFRRRE